MIVSSAKVVGRVAWVVGAVAALVCLLAPLPAQAVAAPPGLATTLPAGRAAAAAEAAAPFPDVPADHPLAAAIAELADKGVIGGYADGLFRPEKAIWRQQFAKMLVLALDLPVSEQHVCAFPDVEVGGPDTFYPDNYVAVVHRWSITFGVTPEEFAPAQEITRAQVVSLVARALNQLRGDALDYPPSGFRSRWGQFDPGHAWAADLAEHNGLLAGFPETGFDPWAPMPRAEVAHILSNTMALLGRHPSHGKNAEVVRVPDSETLRVIFEGRTEDVHLIGVDAPESPDPFSTHGRFFLLDARHSPIQLEFDARGRDDEGHLLAYAWKRDRLLNAELLRLGAAAYRPEPPNLAHATELAAAEAAARAEKVGMWTDPALFRTVMHPYRNRFYEPGCSPPRPAAITADLRWTGYPGAYPGLRFHFRPIPSTDLVFAPATPLHPAVDAPLEWRDPEVEHLEELRSDLGNPHPPVLHDDVVARQKAEAFLKAHGLWQPDVGGPVVSWGSRVQSGSVERITSWIVRFPQESHWEEGEIPGGITVRIGPEDRAMRVTWNLLDLEEDGVVRLRPLDDVLADTCPLS
ncbi:MAG: S-layer homology domain-containing protein [Thermoleophilia bacterium]